MAIAFRELYFSQRMKKHHTLFNPNLQKNKNFIAFELYVFSEATVVKIKECDVSSSKFTMSHALHSVDY